MSAAAGDAPDRRALHPWMRKGPLRGLQHTAFRTFWTAYAVTQLGFWMSNVTLQWVTARLTDSDPFHLGLLYFFNLTPLLFISPWAGVAADRYQRRRLVSASHLGIALLSAGLVTYLVATPDVALVAIYAFAFALGCLMAFSAPAAQAIVVGAVPPEDVGSAVGLQAASLNVARIIGPGLATPLLVKGGAAGVFAIYAATSAAAAAAIARLPLRPNTPPADARSTWGRIADGVRHVRERPPAGAALAMVAGTSLLSGCYVSQLPVLAFDVLGGSDATFAALVTMTGMGAVIGAMWSSARPGVPRIGSVALTMLAMPAVLIAMTNVPHVGFVMAAAVIASALNFAVMTNLNILLQSVVSDAMRGRVMSLYILAWGGVIPLGALLLGALASETGLSAAMIIVGACHMVFASIILAGVAGHRTRITRTAKVPEEGPN